jgi:hypothetical protein
MEHLKVPHSLGRLTILLANSNLARKNLPRTNALAYSVASLLGDKEKSFKTDNICQCCRTFSSLSVTKKPNVIEC